MSTYQRKQKLAGHTTSLHMKVAPAHLLVRTLRDTAVVREVVANRCKLVDALGVRWGDRSKWIEPHAATVF